MPDGQAHTHKTIDPVGNRTHDGRRAPGGPRGRTGKHPGPNGVIGIGEWNAKPLQRLTALSPTSSRPMARSDWTEPWFHVSQDVRQ